MSFTDTKRPTYDPTRMNVFSGPNSLIDYFNPDKNAPLPLVELPPQLNPFHSDGVRIYAKMLTALPATNVKSLPGTYAPPLFRPREPLAMVLCLHSVCMLPLGRTTVAARTERKRGERTTRSGVCWRCGEGKASSRWKDAVRFLYLELPSKGARKIFLVEL